MIIKKPKFWDKKNNSIFSIILYPISLLYLFFFKTLSFRKTNKFNIPVICVGNIYLGGTGKTPLVREIYEILKNCNKQPAIVKKNYNYLKDEINFLNKFTKLYTSKDRVAGINRLIEDNNKVAILDDGLQDKSINIDFKILCFNAKQWIGNGQVIPSGPLREPVKSVIDYDCIIINGKKDVIKEKVLTKYNPLLNIFYSSYELVEKDFFVGKKIVAFAGIGNPKNFFDLILENNLNLIKSFSYPDHYEFKEKEMNKMLEFSENNNSILITTEKDYFRLNNIYCNKVKAAKVKLNIENHKEFEKLLLNKIK
tara:strand:- start:758 stop:1687 length:930 start_codon:yes stop_codon:yes gene_type:complete